MDNDVVAYEYDILAITSKYNGVKENVPTWYPIYRRSNPVLVASLERIDYTENLGGIASSRGRIGHDETNSLLGVDDEDASNGKGNAFLVHVCGILVVQHIVQIRYLPFLITNDWEFELAPRDLVNVRNPTAMAVDGVGRETDQLDTTFGKLWFKLCEGAQFCHNVSICCVPLTGSSAAYLSYRQGCNPQDG